MCQLLDDGPPCEVCAKMISDVYGRAYSHDLKNVIECKICKTPSSILVCIGCINRRVELMVIHGNHNQLVAIFLIYSVNHPENFPETDLVGRLHKYKMAIPSNRARLIDFVGRTLLPFMDTNLLDNFLVDQQKVYEEKCQSLSTRSR